MPQSTHTPRRPTSRRGLFYISIAVIIFCNAVQLFASVWTWSRDRCHYEASASASAPVLNGNAYTWEGDDFPPYLPIDFGPPVALKLENSIHYALDSPSSNAEYMSLYPGDHLGFVRLGPKKRFFGLAMFHQIHCLDSLRKAIVHNSSGGSQEETSNFSAHAMEHAGHCLDYLRQTILCAADVTLEPEVPVEGTQDVGEGVGVEHVCRDWSKVYEFVEEHNME